MLRFIIRIVIPLIIATRDVQSKVKDINENMKGFQSGAHSTPANDEPSKSQSKSASAKGDYIDFEEIK